MTTDAEADKAPDQEEHAVHTKALETKALKGTYFVVLFYAIALSMRFVFSAILTHIFSPEYFGILTLLTTVLVGLNLFSHIGLQDSIIQNPRGDEPLFLNTTWTLQVLRGILLWVMTIVLAWPVARFYHEPRMILLFPALGFGCVIAGFSSPSLLSLARHLGVGKLSLLELFQQVLQFAVTWIWAYYYPTLWALIAGRIASELLRTIISYFMMREIRPRFAWDKECVHTLITFGKWILIGTALNFLAAQSDRLILGKLISFSMLGVYGIAFSLSDLPRQIIAQFCSRVGFPFIARFADKSRAEYRRILLKYRLPVLAVGGLMLIFVICFGDTFIFHVYDKRYHEAAWMTAILAVGLWHTLLYSTINPAILSLSKAHYNAAEYMANCVTLFILIPVGFHFYGMVGAVVAVALSDLPNYFVALYAAYREKVGTFLQDVLMTLGFGAALAGALALRMALGFGSPFFSR